MLPRSGRVARAVLRRLAPSGSRRRTALLLAQNLAARAGPSWMAAVGLRRYRDTWKNRDVALQMRDLARSQLEDPLSAAPYRVFIESITWLLDAYRMPQPARLLDFGCGTGHYSALLDHYFPGRFSYLGCDYAREMIDVAREEWPGREFVVNDLFANTLDLDSFDVICASALVDVLTDYERALDVLLSPATPYVLLHRQQITAAASHAEVAGGYRGQLTYRSYLRREDLERVAARHGRTIARVMPVDGNVFTLLFVRPAGGEEL
jgi:SAM-dependent methyltransferase